MAPLEETVRPLLIYPPRRVQEPIVYRLVVEYGLVPNVRRANVEPDGGGFIYLELTGEVDETGLAVAWLESLGIETSVVGLDGQREWAV